MARVLRLELEEVDTIPAELEPGLLYVSNEYGVAIHLCACGCGNQAVTSLWPGEWTLTEGPTLSPSIEQRFACRSHYFIRGGKVEWC